MIKKTICVVLLCLLPTLGFAHSLLLDLFDNEDGTLTITGHFSTGETAEGATIRIESLATGTIIL